MAQPLPMFPKEYFPQLMANTDFQNAAAFLQSLSNHERKLNQLERLCEVIVGTLLIAWTAV
jgi:hypothetical protein